MVVWLYLNSKFSTCASRDNVEGALLPDVCLSQGFGGEEDAMRQSSRFGSLLLVEALESWTAMQKFSSFDRNGLGTENDTWDGYKISTH